MTKLIPENFDFAVSFPLSVEFCEPESARVIVPVDLKGSNESSQIAINFQTVAEVRCISANYFELNYKNFEISEGDGWGFYRVAESPWLKNVEQDYDPKHRLGLIHFLIAGTYSYVEILAAGYDLSYL